MRKISLLSLVIVALTTALPVHAQDERITLDWIFSDEGKTAMSLPRRAWLDDDRLVTYDTRRAKDERTLTSFNASSGRARDLVDAGKVVAAMNEMFEPEEPYEELGWPSAFDSTASWAVYTKAELVFPSFSKGSQVSLLQN